MAKKNMFKEVMSSLEITYLTLSMQLNHKKINRIYSIHNMLIEQSTQNPNMMAPFELVNCTADFII